ncbi:hypothetical protein [Burkholderia anthina]|uniref:hypothetical protein n=1 Tax=Burkholderia anthina TaxID=179879 RepID=UPI00158A05DC|nr:hypothetical protein [Burkholderia anthina]
MNRGWRIISHYYRIHIPVIPACSIVRPGNIRAQQSNSNARYAAKFGAGTPRAADRQKIPTPASRPPRLLQNIPLFMRSRIKHAFDERHLHDWPEAISRY